MDMKTIKEAIIMAISDCDDDSRFSRGILNRELVGGFVPPDGLNGIVDNPDSPDFTIEVTDGVKNITRRFLISVDPID